MLILPKEYKNIIEVILYEFRKTYPLPEKDIYFAAYKIRKTISEKAKSIKISDLKDGAAYLEVYFSKKATAFNGRTRNQIPEHGDIYLAIWRWDANRKIFWSKNSMDVLIEKKPIEIFQPLIEYTLN